jgi:hypothetical protein
MRGPLRVKDVGMADPLTLSLLGGSLLTQGVTFLYGQAGELLRRRRAGREQVEAPEPAPEPEAFEGSPAPLRADPGVLDRVADDMAGLRRALSDYADGIRPVTASDEEFLAALDALRGLVEAVYGQRFTLRGESREPSGPVVTGVIDVQEVLGRAVAVRAGQVSGSANIRAEATARRVEEGGEVIGADIDRIG